MPIHGKTASMPDAQEPGPGGGRWPMAVHETGRAVRDRTLAESRGTAFQLNTDPGLSGAVSSAPFPQGYKIPDQVRVRPDQRTVQYLSNH